MPIGSQEKQCSCQWCKRTYSVPASIIPLKWAYPDHHPFCSNKCKNEAGGGNVSNTQGTSNAEQSEKKSGGLLGGLMGGGDAAGKIAQAQMMTSLFASVDEENRQVREVVDQINKMTFSTDLAELSNQLEELAVTGASSDKFPQSGKTLKKACYEKMEFGIMKMKQMGATAEAEFFTKKRKSIKPGWF